MLLLLLHMKYYSTSYCPIYTSLPPFSQCEHLIEISVDATASTKTDSAALKQLCSTALSDHWDTTGICTVAKSSLLEDSETMDLADMLVRYLSANINIEQHQQFTKKAVVDETNEQFHHHVNNGAADDNEEKKDMNDGKAVDKDDPVNPALERKWRPRVPGKKRPTPHNPLVL